MRCVVGKLTCVVFGFYVGLGPFRVMFACFELFKQFENKPRAHESVSVCYIWMLPLEQDGFVVPPFNITVYAWEWVNEFYVVPANLVSSTTGATC